MAVAEGAELLELTDVEDVEQATDGIQVTLRRRGEVRQITASCVVDASGPAAAVASRLGATRGVATEASSSLLYGHFRGLRLLHEVAPRGSAAEASYPEDWAAVHHLLEEGWMYLLRFDDGMTSAGVLIDEKWEGALDWEEPEAVWRTVVDRYPTLSSLFAESAPLRPIESRRRIQHRLSTAIGRRWVAMPHTFGFIDPLFSLGIAWSLRGVERLADLLIAAGPEGSGVGVDAASQRYEALLKAELTQIDRLVATAYRARRRFDLFAAHAMLYFAWVSYAESLERLRRPSKPWWNGLLGAGERGFEQVLVESADRVGEVLSGAGSVSAFEAWVASTIEPFNIAGLADERRGNVYPVDLGLLVRQAGKLGLEPEVIEAALPRLLR